MVKEYFNKFSTSAQKIPAIFYVFVIIVISLWLLLDKCSGNKPSHVADNQQNNQFIKWKDSATISFIKHDRQDSTTISRLQNIVDSTTTKLSIMDQMLSRTQAKAVGSATNMQIAKKNNDTAAYIINCDSLGNETIDLSIQINQARDSVKSLIRTKDSLQAATESRVKSLRDFASGMRTCCDTTTKKYSELYKDYKPLLRKANKKFAFGIGGGAALGSDAKFGGSVGIYIIRKLISF